MSISYSTGATSDDNPADFELPADISAQVRFNSDGLVPAIVQSTDNEVLMLAWQDAHALAYTLATGRGTYYSRSRQEYWIKGLTSGHFQKVIDVALDCDGDTVLMTVEQTGAACHTGQRTCFDERSIFNPPA
ncbi:phosphoribosyl-AMP cyclohydrolase [Corynebacterium aquilae]|uniref:Phosphoribosyl-AMP cyclohydrolase n=1 Tax=Corynebacterium aquilae DSM 44791 TaxID=1431546 RepID=A0A1L7CGU0_9CORY|nr:phosphoribosyl-AMP cyclohydrolase [Corynebacterium aquilae]APT85049.1 phosphoribosyl-AMP cyclohydrolase [Corynebacterium aquilae DSM 44791]